MAAAVLRGWSSSPRRWDKYIATYIIRVMWRAGNDHYPFRVAAWWATRGGIMGREREFSWTQDYSTSRSCPVRPRKNGSRWRGAAMTEAKSRNLSPGPAVRRPAFGTGQSRQRAARWAGGAP